MLAIITYVALVAVWFIVWPGGARFLFVAPFFGTALGGFTWGLVALLNHYFITSIAFVTFVVIGVFLAECLALVID